MSKHDSSPRMTEDRSEQLLSSEAFMPEKSGLGKEIKISLAAITVLLGVLGYVLYGHFFGSDEESGEISAAAAVTPDGAPATGAVGTEPAGDSLTTDRSMAGGATATAESLSGLDAAATTESRWGGTIRQEQPSTSQSGARDASSGFSFMPTAVGRTPSAPMPQTATDQYSPYGGSPITETSARTGSSDATADPSPYGGQPRDPFQREAAQGTAGSYASQLQTGGYASQPQTGGYASQPQTGSQAYSNRQYDFQRSATSGLSGTAVVVSDTDNTASLGLGQSTALQSRTDQPKDASGGAEPGGRVQAMSQYPADRRDYGTTGSSVRIQAAPQYSTNSQGYATSSTYGHTGGTSSTQVESRSSSQDYNASSQPSVPQASAGFSTVSASPDSNQYAFPADDASDGKYTVKPNDNYCIISKKLYDTESYFKALAQHNRAAFPDADRLDVGKEIETPAISELERLYPDLCPKPEHRDAIKHRISAAGTAGRSAGATVYVVQEGDTLFDIARYELGKAARWAEIYQLNRDRLGKDFDYLTPGLELVMPAKVVPTDQPAGTMTQRSGALRRF